MSNKYLSQPIAIGMLALGLNAHAQQSTAPRAIPADSGVEAQVVVVVVSGVVVV